VCSQDPDIAGLTLRIHQAILAESLLDNKLVRVNKPAIP
jgi:hypothetical protein